MACFMLHALFNSHALTMEEDDDVQTLRGKTASNELFTAAGLVKGASGAKNRRGRGRLLLHPLPPSPAPNS